MSLDTILGRTPRANPWGNFEPGRPSTQMLGTADYSQRNAMPVWQQSIGPTLANAQGQAFAPYGGGGAFMGMPFGFGGSRQQYSPADILAFIAASKQPRKERHIGIGGQDRTGAPGEWSSGSVYNGTGVGGQPKMGTAENPFSWDPRYTGAAGRHSAFDNPALMAQIDRNVTNTRAWDIANRPAYQSSFMPNSGDVMQGDQVVGRSAANRYGGGFSTFPGMAYTPEGVPMTGMPATGARLFTGDSGYGQSFFPPSPFTY